MTFLSHPFFWRCVAWIHHHITTSPEKWHDVPQAHFINFDHLSLIAHRPFIITPLLHHHHHHLSTPESCLLIGGEREGLFRKGTLMAMHRQLTMALGGLRVPPPVKTQGSLWLRQYHHVTNVAIRGQAHLLLVAPPLPPPPPLTLPLLPQPPPCLAFVGSRGPEFSKAPPRYW